MSFQTWYENADMPEKLNGVWVDLEDGIAYCDKSFESDLKGSFKQIVWAKSIRLNLLKSSSLSDREIILYEKSAKFFIENRSLGLSEILNLIYQKMQDDQKKKSENVLLSKEKAKAKKRVKEIQAMEWKTVSTEVKQELYELKRIFKI